MALEVSTSLDTGSDGEVDWLAESEPSETESKLGLRLVGVAGQSIGTGCTRRLETYYTLNECVQLMCRPLGIPENAVDWDQGASRTFRCPLHPDDRAGATLTRSPKDRAWTLKCPHVAERYTVWQLPQVYAALEADVSRSRLKGGQLAVWSLKLLVHSGVIVPPKLPTLLSPERPDELSAHALKVLRVAQDLTCWRLGWTGEIDFPMSQRLGMDWTRLNVRRYRDGLSELLEHGVLFKVGEYHAGHKRPGHIFSFLPLTATHRFPSSDENARLTAVRKQQEEGRQTS